MLPDTVMSDDQRRIAASILTRTLVNCMRLDLYLALGEITAGNPVLSIPN